MNKIIAAFCLIAVLATCTNKELEDSTIPQTNIYPQGVVFTDSKDPRLAEIVSSDKERITFFGKRSVDGTPVHLSAYCITSLANPGQADVITFDSNGRYSNILLRTGEGLHLDYVGNDSVRISISKDSGFVGEVPVRSSTIRNTTLYSRAPATHIIESIGGTNDGNGVADTYGKDGNINVKVTARNTVDQYEEDVIGEQTSVMIRLIGQKYDYTVPLNYDLTRKLYSFPLLSLGFKLGPDFIDKTGAFIKNALQVACSSPQFKAKNIVDLLKGACDLPPTLPTKAACLFARSGVFICDGTKYISLFLDLIAKNLLKADPNSPPIGDGAVITTSKHINYGSKTGLSTTVNQVLLSGDPYDVKIIHDYTSKGPRLAGSKYLEVSWRFESVPGYVNIAASCNPPMPAWTDAKILTFVNSNTYTISVTDSTGKVVTVGPASYSIGPYSPDSLFLTHGPGYDCTSSYGRQYTEGWGTKITPGYDLKFGETWPTRISSDGRQIYSAQGGDAVYIKQ